MTPMMTLVLHLIYGGALGWTDADCRRRPEAVRQFETSEMNRSEH